MLTYSISIHGNSNGEIMYDIDVKGPSDTEKEKMQVINEVISCTHTLVDNLQLRKEPISRSQN